VERLAKRNAQGLKVSRSEAVPDRGFVKQLKKLDSSFEVLWDKGSKKWEIWSFPDDSVEPYMVMKVQTEGKTFRQLGQDILVQMQQNVFMANNLSAKQICDYLDEMDTQEQRRKEKDFRNKIDAVARDTFLYTQGVLQVQVPRTLKIERAVSYA
jgi:hypothetical protein